MRKYFLLIIVLLFLFEINAQQSNKFILLKPDRVFDGEQMQSGWVVLLKDDTIVQAGNMSFKLPAGTQIIELKGYTLLPGLIEGHSHLFLHPYNETKWEDQVLKESRAERTARAVNHAKATLMAGFTTVRDLGTEGSMYDDAGLKKAIEKGVIPGPRMIVATRAIVAKGTYAPKSESPDVELPQGAEEVAGLEDLTRAIRSQIGHGADFIKVYADYHSLNNEVHPTFSQLELEWTVTTTSNSGRKVVAHATSPEGMKRAVNAGVSTIEHGDNGTEEIFKLMKEKNVPLCTTHADSHTHFQCQRKTFFLIRDTFRIGVNAFAPACIHFIRFTGGKGGDVGVFAHGDNAREMELMVDYGMKPLDVLKSATSVNADAFGYADKIGRIKKGLLADIIAVEGDPSVDIKNIRKVKLVMKNGEVYKQ